MAESKLTKRLTVLVVDDNLDQVQTMAYLVRDGGHDVDYAINGIVALELAQRMKPDVIVLDIGLPDTNGFHFVRQIRRNPELRNTRVVGVTGMNIERHDALSRGFDALLKKPVKPGELDAALFDDRDKG